MNIDRNNNKGIIWRIAKSNLQGNRLQSIFTVLTIILAVSLITGLAMVQRSGEKEKQQILNSMQQVMYMNITEQQVNDLEQDQKTEIMVPYKEGNETKKNGVKLYPIYMESHGSGIVTYVPTEGKVPEQTNEIAVDKQFLKAMGIEAKLGMELKLSFMDEEEETFVVSGLIEREYQMSRYPVFVSRAYADNGEALKDIPYTALVKISGADDMQLSEFSSAVDTLALKYGIERNKINVNGNFEYSLQNTSVMLLIGVVGIIILFAAAVVICSIFYLSVVGRIQQIGQLRTIGMTEKQVNRMIRCEGLLLSGIAIPAGIFLGNVFAYMIKPAGWDILNFILVTVAAGVFGVLAVLFSVSRPAKIAGKVSPVEAVRYLGDEDSREGKDRPHRRLTVWRLAKTGRESNQKRGALTTASLAIGGILLMVGASYMAAWDAEEYSRIGGFENGEYIVDYLYDAHGNAQKYGITDLQMEGTLSEEVKQRIEGIPNVEEVYEEVSTHAILKEEDREALLNVYPITDENKGKLNAVLDAGSTDTLEQNTIIIINSKIMESIFDLSLDVGKEVQLQWYNGSDRESTVEIVGIRKSADKNGKLENGVYISEDMVNEMWPGMNKTSSFLITAQDYEKNKETIEAQILDILDDYKKLKLRTLRERQIDDAEQTKNLNMQVQGLTLFIIIFSIFNMINTSISSIAARRREFAMLESIGMQQRQIAKMLCLESIYLAIPNIIITLTAGGLAGFAMVEAMRKFAGAMYMHYQFPVAKYGVYAVCMVLIPMLIAVICLRMQNKASLVERINVTD